MVIYYNKISRWSLEWLLKFIVPGEMFSFRYIFCNFCWLLLNLLFCRYKRFCIALCRPLTLVCTWPYLWVITPDLSGHHGPWCHFAFFVLSSRSVSSDNSSGSGPPLPAPIKLQNPNASLRPYGVCSVHSRLFLKKLEFLITILTYLSHKKFSQ